jgi:hypothetical protein
MAESRRDFASAPLGDAAASEDSANEEPATEAIEH